MSSFSRPQRAKPGRIVPWIRLSRSLLFRFADVGASDMGGGVRGVSASLPVGSAKMDLHWRGGGNRNLLDLMLWVA
jgi:hypothetical protein